MAGVRALLLCLLLFLLPFGGIIIPLVIVIYVGGELICFMFSIRRSRDKRNGPHPDTHFRCPDCKELILKEANICKHCGCTLVPPDNNGHGLGPGLTIVSVEKSSQGEKLGLNVEDVILSYNGDNLSTNNELSNAMYHAVKKGKTSVEILVKQNGKVNKILAAAGALGISCRKVESGELAQNPNLDYVL